MTKYYCLILTQEEFFKNQVIEEVLRERVTFLLNEQKPIDFWIVTSPRFFEQKEIQEKLIKTQFFEQHTNIFLKEKVYCTMFISTNFEYFKWLRLRLGYFEDFITTTPLQNQKFKSNGLFGIFDENMFNIQNLFQSQKPILHPKIRLEKLNEVFSY